MLHLSSERLAALVDSEPTPLEADHLACCAYCARERAVGRALLMMARAEREQLGMPLTRWDSLAPDLHRAGLVTAGALMSAAAPETRPDRAERARHLVRWLQAAVVVLLVGGGAALGRLSAGASPLALEWSTRVGAHAGDDLTRRSGPTAGLSHDHVGPTEFSSVEQAVGALRRYEQAYQRATAYLADHDPTIQVDDSHAYRARLTALDRATRAMTEALRAVPYDPVINGYYLTTLGQREATLRQLETTLPSGYRIRSF